MTCETCNGSGESITEEIVDDCPNCTANGICPSCGKQWSNETIEYYYDCIDNYRINNFVCPFCEWQGGGE